MRLRIPAIIIFLVLPACSFSLGVKVTGYAGGNRSEIIRVYSYSDPVTGRERAIQTLIPGDDGSFSFELDNEGVNEYFIRNGVNDNHFFIDGSNNVELVLYPYTSLTPREKQDPFFEYIDVHAATRGAADLNNMILRFEDKYLEASNKLASLLHAGNDKNQREMVVRSLENFAVNGENPFFDSWVRFRVAALRISAVYDRNNQREIISSVEDLFDPGNRACTEFIRGLFSTYLRNLTLKPGGEIIRKSIEGGFSALPVINFAKSDSLVSNSRMLEYIIIENFYKEYYSNYFNREGIYSMIRWLGMNAVYEYSRELAGKIRDIAGRFAEGSPLPLFQLAGPGGEEYGPLSFRGKFLLISFAQSGSFTTLSEYNLIAKWKDQYSDHLEVVTILCDNDYKKGLAGMSEKGFDWIMLDGSGNEDIIALYDVTYFPSFILADPEGNIIKAPAPFPSENLFRILLEKLQPYLLDDIRKR